MSRRRVLVGMSGGVDSAVTAYLLQKSGYDVIGMTLKTWVGADGRESRCCEIGDAQAVCDRLGIPYYVQNCLPEFREQITRPFVREYLRGRTPNPCVICNSAVKWSRLLDAADAMHSDYIATGHYASVVRTPDGRYTVQRGAFSRKDQSYMLYRLTQEQLARTLMPLGRLSKDEVRGIAEYAGIPVAEKADSQEICFVPDGHYAGFIEENAEQQLPPDGDFTDGTGAVLGRHHGIYRYTVGQRRGLGVAAGKPVYVQKIDAEANRIILGDAASLMTGTVLCGDLCFMGIPALQPGEQLAAAVRIRYHHPAQAAVCEMLADGTLHIRFREPVRAAVPGQSAVAYDSEGRVLCGGIILPEPN
ncbi:MAG: tRNA 2-thiouridine(34) synthase MnmA [Oscillospiraceae bacterium]|nr:tRNA 2-thiouridine(34) synthase MnmA [Oscillospiraceae bacterium]